MPKLIQTTLQRHPAQAEPRPCTLTASVERDRAGWLHLVFTVRGQDIRRPPPGQPGPADGLWQQTCCEAFVGEAGSSAYREFNFSPSGQWAAYRFTAYRQPDTRFVPAAQPQSRILDLANGFELHAAIPPALLPKDETWPVGLSCVLEAGDQSKTYWALAHGAAQPDFHLPATFTLSLKAPRP